MPIFILKWILGLGVLAAGLAACPGGNGFEGHVRDVQLEPVAGALIEARRVAHGAVFGAELAGPPKAVARSDRAGFWSLSGLGGGTWLIAIVASGTRRSDSELQELARSTSPEGPPPGVAITRLIRRCGPQPLEPSTTYILQPGVALGSDTEDVLRGRLMGSFDPLHYGYEIALDTGLATPESRSVRLPSGGYVATASSDQVRADFTAVPAADGSFDFGRLPVSEHARLSIKAFLLAADDPIDGMSAQIFSAPVAGLKDVDGSLSVRLRTQRAVGLHASASGQAVEGRMAFSVWNEEAGANCCGAIWYRESDRISLLFTEGTWLVRASTDDFASPLVPLVVDSAGPVDEIELPLSPCKPFSVRFVDEAGAPLSPTRLNLGVPGSSDFPVPCRVSVFSRSDEVRFEHILPGTYDIEFHIGAVAPFTRRVELTPDGPAIVVSR